MPEKERKRERRREKEQRCRPYLRQSRKKVAYLWGTELRMRDHVHNVTYVVRIPEPTVEINVELFTRSRRDGVSRRWKRSSATSRRFAPFQTPCVRIYAQSKVAWESLSPDKKTRLKVLARVSCNWRAWRANAKLFEGKVREIFFRYTRRPAGEKHCVRLVCIDLF